MVERLSRKSHESRLCCYPSWLADYLSDPRLIHNLPRSRREGQKRAGRIEPVTVAMVRARKPRLALSFDVEHDRTYPAESSLSETAAPFLRRFARALRGTSIKATFYVQGEMVPAVAGPLTILASEGHVIGLHGYRHELWGRNNWVKRRAPITRATRRERIEASLWHFVQAGLPSPGTFRAPIFTIDSTTYDLLEEYRFTTDSSPPTQRGNLMRPALVGRMRVVPVSCAPLPVMRVNPRLRIPTVAYYYQFDFNTLINTPDDLFHTLVDQTLRFQVACGVEPYLTVYGHNWEFEADNPDRNLFLLFDRLYRVQERFAMVWATIPQMADRLFPDTEGRVPGISVAQSAMRSAPHIIRMRPVR